MSRGSSIDALLRKSDGAMSQLEEDYRKSLDAKTVSEELKIDIKNILENLRSSLDYLARDIHEKYATKSAKRLYFPIRHTRKEFEEAIARDFSGLEIVAPEVYSALERVQPYNEPWLGEFNSLNNNNKHQDLVEQTKKQSRRVTVSSKRGEVQFRGAQA